jgi:hypothetical protein
LRAKILGFALPPPDLLVTSRAEGAASYKFWASDLPIFL